MDKLIFRILFTLVLASILILFAIPSQASLAQTSNSAPPLVTAAKAQISGSGISGTINVNQSSAGYVLIDAVIQGDPKILTSGLHGFHIHEKGVCQENGKTPFSSAGGHFDPGPFGSSTPVEANHPYHLGDLPNIKVDEGGMGRLKTITSRITISDSPVSIFDSDGSSIIVHKLTDLVKAGATAADAGGGRLACGVIEAFKP